jgi:hypothetical protein
MDKMLISGFFFEIIAVLAISAVCRDPKKKLKKKKLTSKYWRPAEKMCLSSILLFKI